MASNPTLKPEESSSRATESAVLLTYINAALVDFLSQVYSDHEIFHCQMHLIYCLVDLMSFNNKSTPLQVLEVARLYFERLEREREALNVRDSPV